MGGKSGISHLPDCLSINSYQDDGYELLDKSSLRIEMMGDCRALMLIKFSKSALCGVIPRIKQINVKGTPEQLNGPSWKCSPFFTSKVQSSKSLIPKSRNPRNYIHLMQIRLSIDMFRLHITTQDQKSPSQVGPKTSPKNKNQNKQTRFFWGGNGNGKGPDFFSRIFTFIWRFSWKYPRNFPSRWVSPTSIGTFSSARMLSGSKSTRIAAAWWAWKHQVVSRWLLLCVVTCCLLLVVVVCCCLFLFLNQMNILNQILSKSLFEIGKTGFQFGVAKSWCWTQRSGFRNEEWPRDY